MPVDTNSPLGTTLGMLSQDENSSNASSLGLWFPCTYINISDQTIGKVSNWNKC